MRGGYSPVIWGPGGVATVIAPSGLSGLSATIVKGAGNDGAEMTGTSEDINWTETLDADGLWNGTQFTAADAGEYLVVGAVLLSGSSGNTYNAYVDTVKGISLSDDRSASFKRLSGVVTLAAGEVLSIRSNLTVTLSASTEHHIIAITKL